VGARSPNTGCPLQVRHARWLVLRYELSSGPSRDRPPTQQFAALVFVETTDSGAADNNPRQAHSDLAELMTGVCDPKPAQRPGRRRRGALDQANPPRRSEYLAAATSSGFPRASANTEHPTPRLEASTRCSRSNPHPPARAPPARRPEAKVRGECVEVPAGAVLGVERDQWGAERRR
jgi:hypothetical protein